MKNFLITPILLVLLMGTGYSQSVKIPLIGSKAPSFTATSTNGDITFPESFGKSWKILFSHPQDFTPVCSSELLELAYSQKEFEDLGVKIAIISTDGIETHKMWKASLEELNYKGRGKQKIEFPIIDDHTIVASKKYGMLHEPTSTNKDIRGVFVIDPNNIVRSINFYPMNLGRNIEEIKRIVIALQTSEKLMVSIPANWKIGDDFLVPHFPYTKQELADNPKLEDDYYSVGNRLWFMKAPK
ncbi:MAG TPA: peroxiredoxin [Prolixibacteraceae bacterium]|jgi:peroxiredoxin (alkyl hydroperoxide reductase subunit C)|nr:peroxiredoxin [Prolixibacteraceae bacterium]